LKLDKIYKLAVEKGILADPRDKKEIKRLLKKEDESFKKLKKDEKLRYDKDRLFNPFTDTRILNGDGGTNVKKVMVGIDIDTSEMLLADRLNQKGEKIDLVIAHHPSGRAMPSFHEVMSLQADVLHKFGVPINVAESILEPRIKQVEKRVMPANHTKAQDAAKLLGIPFICLHTPADNCVVDYLQKIFDKKKCLTVEDVINELNKVKEYQIARDMGTGPKVVVGSKTRRAGKVMVEMTGGTEGSQKAFEKLSAAGVGTIVAMHFTEEHLKQAEKHHINVVIAGHIASDNVGINILLDYIMQKGNEKLKIIESSGFRRNK
jgi:putative NIF3 family GTP cyclohydrolase 1 type 2